MADEVKRVGLVLKADGTTDFVKSLKLVNAELKSNYENFKLTQAQWNNSVTTTQKLNDKLTYLNQAYEIQSSKVTTLKEQLENLENAENKDETAIERKRAALTKAEASLQKYKNQIEDTKNKLKLGSEAMIEFGNKVQEKGKKIEEAGKKLSAFSAASLAALTASAKGAIEFESAFAGVEKTVDATEEQFKELKQGIRDMSKELPSSTTEISEVAEAAGQLGIKTENILSFSKAMLDLGNSTNLTAEEAASQLAKFANIMQMSQSDFDRLGSSIVDLGNNFATTEADIVDMAMRLAGAGKQVGLSEGQVLGLATALSSVGIEAEMGGSAISKAMVNMQNAVELGGEKMESVLKKTGMSLRDLELLSANNSKDFKELADSIGLTSTELNQMIKAGTNLEDFAKISGMTAEEFKKAWKEDATGALTAFIKGLGNTEEQGESAIAMLSEMGITEVRLRDSLLRAANAGNLFNNAIETGTKAWEENTALTNEANKRYDTLESKIKIVLNKIKDMGITIGNKLMPSIEKIITQIGKWVDKFNQLDEKQVDTIIKIGLLITAIGPLLTIIGKITSVVGGAVKGFGTFIQAVGVMSGKVGTTSTSVANLANVLGAITSPIGIAIAGITGLTSVLVIAEKQFTKNVEKSKEIRQGIEDEVKARQELKSEQEKQIISNLAEIDNTANLYQSLKEITDENGNIKEGYKKRAEFIVTKLKEALGKEIEINGNVIQGYKDIQNEIDKTIAKKKAEAFMQGQEQEYTENIKKRTEAYETLVKLQNDFAEAQERVVSAQEKISTSSGLSKLLATEELRAAKTELQNLGIAMQEQEGLIAGYTENIKTYDTNTALMAQNTTESFNKVIDNSIAKMSEHKIQLQGTLDEKISAIQGNLEKEKSLMDLAISNQDQTNATIYQNQVEADQKQLEELANQLLAMTIATEEATPEQIEGWKKMATDSYDTYFDTIAPLDDKVREKIEQMTGVTAQKTPELVTATQVMAQRVLEQIEKNPEFKQEAINNLQGMLNGLEDGQLRGLLEAAGTQDVDKVMKGIRDGNLAEDEGLNILKSLKSGLNSSKWQNSLFSVARGIASTLSGLLTVKANVNGNLSKLPGHKSGLDYVPKDNYVARLHKGERVLTKEENKDYTESEKRNKKRTYTANSTRSNNEVVYNEKIDYEKISKMFLKALNSCKIKLDRDGFVRFIDDRLMEVM